MLIVACELDARQKRKYLPFRKLRPPKKNSGFQFFPIPYRPVYVACSYFWPGIGQLESKTLGVRYELRHDEAILRNTEWSILEIAFKRNRVPSEVCSIHGN